MTDTLIINFSIIMLLLPAFGFGILIVFGKKYPKLHWLEIGILSIGLILAIVVLITKLTTYLHDDIAFNFVWINFSNISLLDSFKIRLGVKIDNITAIMLFVVNLISFLVHVYSLEYMKGDPRFNRYYAFLGVFTFSMIGIVISDNLLMIYIFWELVGLSSYLLIGFWYEKKSASDAGKKAFLTNRIGDIGMLVGILILFTTYNTFSFDSIFHQISLGKLPFDSTAWLTVTGILIFLGAVGKSAQFPLHVWLPDAMEGPTPVSALIHSATMVAAGVYLSLRIFVMLTADAMLVVAIVGAVTSFLAATIALTQNDIKRVLAYSTVSQLGYMIMSVGIGAYAFAFFHLVTHAFFKSNLFLGSGSVIHSMHHEQDMRQMGGLRKKMPVTYAAFIVSSLAISGIPLTSGFLSKDGILAGSLAFGHLTGHWLMPTLGFLVALMTAFYMFRLIIMTFHGKPRNIEKYEHAHETPFVMTMPLVVLSLLSIFFWYTLNPVAPEDGWFLHDWVKTPAQVTPIETRFDFMVNKPAQETSVIAEGTHGTAEVSSITNSEEYEHALHWAHIPSLILSLTLGGLGILLAYLIYQWKYIDPDKMADKLRPLYLFSLNKWYIDEFYHATFIGGTIGLSKLLSLFDKYVVDGLVNGTAFFARLTANISDIFDRYIVDGMVNGTAFMSGLFGLSLRKLQTGKVQTYIVFVVFSILILLLLFKPF